jgi:hypothetical protein
MTRAYQVSVSAENVERASSTPPFPADNTVLRHEWNFSEPEFYKINELRAWIADEGLQDVTERGFAGAGGQLAAGDSLVRISTSATLRGHVVRSELVDEEVCPTCGRPELRIAAEASIRLDREPRVGKLLTYIAGVEGFAMPRAAAETLVASGLAGGLRTVSAKAPGEPHVVLSSEVAVGEPVAPFGTTGECCLTCGRSYRRTRVGAPYPALPRYAMYWIFERPPGDAQWVWNAVDGPLRPMVTHEVAEWLAERDPQITFVKRGWSPDELDEAFLAEPYR